MSEPKKKKFVVRERYGQQERLACGFCHFSTMLIKRTSQFFRFWIFFFFFPSDMNKFVLVISSIDHYLVSIGPVSTSGHWLATTNTSSMELVSLGR